MHLKKEYILKLLNIYSMIIIVLVSIFGFYMVPKFIGMFDSFRIDEALPFATLLILTSYKYWILFLSIPVMIHLAYFHQKETRKLSTLKRILILLFSIIALIIIIQMIMISLYLPIFELGKEA